MNPEDRMKHTILTQKRMGQYAKFLENAIEKGWWIFPVGVVNECEPTDKVLGILHFFQGDLEMAREVGILEKAFNLHTSFACPPTYLELYSFVRDLGHEPVANFSIFNRDPSVINEFSRSPSSILIEHLGKYRELGSQPDGILLPKNPVLEGAKMEESHYFAEYGEQKTVTLNMQNGDQVHFRMGIHPLREFGLSYSCTNVVPKMHIDSTPETLNELNEVIETGSGKQVCILNPQNWEVSC